MNRRQIVQGAAAAIGLGLPQPDDPPGSPSLCGAAGPAAPQGAPEAGGRIVTCFYQFGQGALDALRVLPNGPRYLHIFSHSHPGMRPHPDTAKAVRALGSSFKYALALDVHKYRGWGRASDDQLKTWAREFRAQALHPDGPADYFAFNEMPTTGAATPALRERAAAWLRYLHDPGDGPRLPGVFYFTERNLNPRHWIGPADDFWAALDETCELVVGEHYHSYEFALGRTPEQLAEHLFALPRWLREGGKPAAARIAARKYAVLHSSYYGTEVTGWAGVRNEKHAPEALETYFRHLVAATRRSELGKQRIAFGPLAARNLDPRSHAVLARVLEQNLAR